MAQRSTARARDERRAPAGRPAPPRPRPRVVQGGARPGIRWDRIGRVGLLVVLVGLLYLYVGPTITYVETWREAGSRRAEVQKLKVENRKLRERRAALQDPRVLEAEARRLGMVKPGERGYIVKGLPGAPGD
ncbi:septum formation initiator family protein [Conexibacter sp. SYSU D00693]|uniref:FtsB family cell division protein n=1 Tax=Conexibacter sp. SYSU D00693 TaxID=2812560 RepID=UPI00196B383D|nr:septum formation initiator family protein [Conexibacter sp. SYSU D00693]